MVNNNLRFHDLNYILVDDDETDIALPDELKAFFHGEKLAIDQPTLPARSLDTLADSDNEQSTSTSTAAPALSHDQILQNVYKEMNDSSNGRTGVTYAGYIKDFKAWCIAEKFTDGCTVTERKTLIFIHTRVANRETKVKRKGIPEGIVQRIDIQTVKGAVSGLGNLYLQQRNAGMNNNTHPRGNLVKAYLKHLLRLENAKNKVEYRDRAINTLSDGYRQDQFVTLGNAFLSTAEGEGVGIRNRSWFLLQHYGMLRSENSRGLEFADILHHVSRIIFN